MSARPERGTQAHVEWVADWLRRCAEDLGVDGRKLRRDAFLEWLRKQPANDVPGHRDVRDFGRTRKMLRPKPPPREREAEIVAVCSDIHFDLHDRAAWGAFREWHADVKPDRTVILGDFVDLGMMSRYTQGKNDPLHAIEQIRCFVDEANALAKECGELVVVEGNHDERWSKALLGLTPATYRGAIGLTLKDQCHAQGLSRDVTWLREDTMVRGVQCGPFTLRHGHNQSGKFGGGKHIAAGRIAKTLGQSEVVGHHHRGQMFCQTALGRTAIAIANPCLTAPHDYAPDADWQRGFTILELFDGAATPHLIVMDAGRFAFGGKIYGSRR